MPNTATAPNQADAPRPWARAILHAQIPVALKLLLLALFAALALTPSSRRLLRLPRKDWLLTAHCGPSDEQDSPQDWYELRALRRARAELGWLLRGAPNRGMSRLGHRAPVFPPPQAARAPP